MYSVLVIDDDKLARKGLISMTNWAECSLEVVGDVANGRLALEFLKTHKVDLAIVDLIMPVMTGLEFIQESSALYPDMQYIVLSFHEDFEYVQSALRLGAMDFISKLRIEEDCTQSFLAVRGMMQQRRQRKDPQWQSMGISAEDFEALCGRWRKLHWVYNHFIFDRMLDALPCSGLNLQQLERLLVLITSDVNSTFSLAFSVPFLSSMDDGIRQLRQLRDEILLTVLKSPDFKWMSHCVLATACYIQENMSMRLKEQQVAQMVGLSRSYYSSNFRQYSGDTFGNFLRKIRIEQAKLLMQGVMSSMDASLAVGYDDYKYFQQVFKNVTGEYCSAFAKQSPPVSEHITDKL